MKPLSNEELAYWAGFVDGEGSIKIIKRRPGRGATNPSYIPYLAIINTNKAIIEELKRVFETGTIWHKKPSKPNHRDAYGWYVSAKKCVEILKKLLPYLKIKKPQAETLIEYYQKCGGYKWHHEKERFGATTPEHILKMKEEFYQKMKELNKRGRERNE